MSEDIAVVGGSAAGLYAARRLAQAGREVAVYERTPQLDAARRSLIVTHRMLDLLGPIGRGAVVNEITKFELMADGRAATLRLSKPDLIIERSRLIQDLGEAAVASGATINLGSRFVGISRHERGLAIRVKDRQEPEEKVVSAASVIGADGAQSRVARAAGWPAQPTLSLVQALVRLPSDCPSDTTRVWFRPEDTPFFYWLIPEGPDRGALGVIGEDGPSTRARLDSFLAEKSFEPFGYQAAVIPAYARWIPVHRRVGKGNVYLVGDAAGQVKVSTVGGVVTGFRGAAAVSELILSGSSRELARLRRELNIHLLIHRALRAFSQEDYCDVLDGFSPRVERSMTIRSRDQAGRILLSLSRSNPRLLLKGIRALFTGAGSSR